MLEIGRCICNKCVFNNSLCGVLFLRLTSHTSRVSFYSV